MVLPEKLSSNTSANTHYMVGASHPYLILTATSEVGTT